ncbi:phospholipase D family protein [Silicimonas sp. MF1-12-2]|uniref:phospholipase D family protein n=1 Tax=Silicimonas sp. MF1-12-2 TaxID=3384793 RepID=UPI0039B39DE2
MLARLLLHATCLLVLLGCTQVPFDAPREVSRALPAEGTGAARTAARLTGGGADRVALVPLADGNDALGARLQMIEAAERSIDIKTFLIKPDIAGTLMWLKLYEAAERGVRVRILFDDVFTTARDEQIATLDAHPNVDVRIFNPLSRNSPKAINFLFDFGRVNRRMHNKATITDGSFAIIGGRNIADEYYQIGIDHEFADFDLFVAGQPVRDLSSAFDLYWNDRWSLPLSSVLTAEDTPVSEALRQFREMADTEEAQIYRRAITSTYLADVRSGRFPYFLGRAQVVVDSPDKLRSPPGKGPFLVGEALYQMMNKAQTDVLVLTPYFVPEDYGARFFERLVQRGVRVRIATNSLASTNHPYVHGAYASYRERLSAAGVEFLEARSDAAKLTGAVDADLTMHTKLVVVDDRLLFVGSPNMDPRSIRQNAEIGMVIESPELARSIRERIDIIAKDYAFRLTRKPDGSTNWQYDGSTRRETFDQEPLASPWRKILSTVVSWLPIESQL